eukprot:5890143-Alexandrium_andersonii.AAC.1
MAAPPPTDTILEVISSQSQDALAHVGCADLDTVPLIPTNRSPVTTLPADAPEVPVEGKPTEILPAAIGDGGKPEEVPPELPEGRRPE